MLCSLYSFTFYKLLCVCVRASYSASATLSPPETHLCEAPVLISLEETFLSGERLFLLNIQTTPLHVKYCTWTVSHTHAGLKHIAGKCSTVACSLLGQISELPFEVIVIISCEQKVKFGATGKIIWCVRARIKSFYVWL